ncbi:MAG TPA: hypothetical protein VGJ41_09865 [Nocardioides sp.]|jgi:hypothetical protein
MRTPRAFLVSVLTTFVLAAQYLAGDLAGQQVYKHGFDTDFGTGFDLFDQMVVRQLSPFYGTLLGLGDVSPGSRGDAAISFLAGAVLALFLAWLVIWMVARGGSLAALFGTWFAAMAATCSGAVLSALLYAGANDLDGVARQQMIGAAIGHGLQWGFFYGWVPGLAAALLAAMFRKPVAPGPGEPGGEQIPVPHQPFDYLPARPPHQGAQPGPYPGEQQGQQAFPPYDS